MLCLLVDGTIEEINAMEIAKVSSGDGCTYLLMKDGRKISVDETEENLRRFIKSELVKFNTFEPFIRLHLYYSHTKSGYYPICLPISAIKSVSRSYYSYDMHLSGKLDKELPQDAREKGVSRQQPAIIVLNYPVKDCMMNLVQELTVYESAEYISNLIETIN